MTAQRCAHGYLLFMNSTFAVGDPVLVVTSPCRIKTCVGLFGFISGVYPDQGKVSARLLCDPTLDDDADRRREARGDYHAWSVTGTPSDFRPLADSASVARVIRFRDDEARASRGSRVPNALLDEMCSPAAIQASQHRTARIAACSERMGPVFRLPGIIKRGDKSGFPSYRDPEVEKISTELRGYADRGPAKCTLRQMARWKQAREATGATSFWSSRPECRALVKALDLDPMTDGHEGALWTRKGSVYAPNGSLLQEAIKLWNDGAHIHQVLDMEDQDKCWASYKTGEPAGFLIYFAYRRKLPLA